MDEKMYQQENISKREVIDKIMEGYLPKEEGYQKTILQALNYSVRAGGKRIRPCIMMETYRAFTGNVDNKDLYAMMTAIELIHTSSLVHDDLPCMDNDKLRRGRHTTWYQFGEDMGVLAGDALLTYAFEVAASAFQTSDNPLLLGKAIYILAHKTGIYGMIGGQTLDVELTNQPMNAEQMDFIFRLKTGALLEASMMIGAVLAGATQKQQKIVEEIASKIGMAFQIRDDILDVISSTEVLGKPVHSDEKNNKTTYVTLYGMEKAAKDVERLSEEAMEQLRQLPKDTSYLQKMFADMITRNN